VQVSPVKQFSFSKAFRFIVRTYQTEGMLALWRGNSATLLRIIPYAAVQFASHEQWKNLLKVDTTDHKLVSPPFICLFFRYAQTLVSQAESE
jgi:hypothetical protein